MKAIILAAGRGSRMENITDHQPKCLVRIHGKSLLDRQISSLNKAGVKDIGIVTGYKREMIQKHGLFEFHNSRWSETNMVYSLMTAQDWLLRYECIISYSDIFYDPLAITLLILSTSKLAVTYDPNWLKIWSLRFKDPLDDAETFKLDDNNNIIEIGNKASSISEIQGQYMGLLRTTPEAWEIISQFLSSCPKSHVEKMFMTELLQELISKQKISVAGIPYDGYWGEVDTAKDLDLYQSNNIKDI